MHRAPVLALLLGDCFLAATWLAPYAFAAPESWADPNLKVTAGLVAWYDACAENAARRAEKQTRLQDGARVDVWHDASGGAHHLVQTSGVAQPRFRVYEEWNFVRFNGESEYLSASDFGLSFGDVTVFIVAAPFSNDGNFRGVLACSAAGVNDYISGLNVDQGPAASRQFATVNVEGAGFGGAGNLKPEPSPFGQLSRLCVASQVGPGGTKLFLDGQPAGTRDRAASKIVLDRLTVGARYYTNGGPPETRGFLCGEITEVLIYDRRLDDEKIAAVDRYLKKKYDEQRNVPLPPELALLRPIPKVDNPPPVEMLAPGFTARLLPVDLPNVNNVRYRPDGTLVSLGYDGHIHLLTDTDGDGLEDRAAVFWDQPGLTSPIGMALTPPGYERGQGVFVAAHGKVALVVDTDGDDRADRLVVVADGWKPLKVSVDALGIAVGPDGSVYFGLGTGDYTNAYLVDEQQQAHYAESGRGAIMRVSPEFSRREQVCSGVRFSVALAFNRHGDLFCTDQEGATWLPNGNPFDELLHIQPGRHYGFPPRHPKHLPDVIDEPSVYDYAPQHQSTCGLCFDEPATGGRVFGPEWWLGDAIVCGYSRGKLYRTTLVKTDAGYVAEGAVLACLNMLAVDACLSPPGELVVATHSGGPDWGSGPAGHGKLYKIEYEDRDGPQPVRAWAAAPHEVRIAFDRPLDADDFRRFTVDLKIEYGPYVRAGDRFESLWPGYSVVELQARGYRRLLPVLAASLTTDRRGVVLTTDAHVDAVSYAVLLSDAEQASSGGSAALPRVPAVELSYTLGGVEAQWESIDGDSPWSSWLPHFDVQAAQGLLAGSAEGQSFARLCSQPGRLTLRTQLDLWQMLRSATQPGSKLDYVLPAENVTVELESASAFTLRTPTAQFESHEAGAGRHRLQWTVPSAGEEWYPVEIVVATGAGDGVLRASWHTSDDERPRAFAPRRFLLPWARRSTGSAPGEASAPHAALAGGDWHHGRELFFGEQALCGKCHSIRGRGGWIGPDLSNLVHRDYDSVLRDITSPSFAINPEHLAYQVLLDDGRVLTGMVRSRGEMLSIGDIKGVETEVPRASVEEMKPAMISIMPEGLPKVIGPGGMRDLLCFLLLAEPGDSSRRHSSGPGPRRRAPGRKSASSSEMRRRSIPRNSSHWTSCWSPDRKTMGPASTTIRPGKSDGRSCSAEPPRSRCRMPIPGRRTSNGNRPTWWSCSRPIRPGRPSRPARWTPTSNAAEGWCCCTTPSTASGRPRNSPAAWDWPGTPRARAIATVNWI